MPLFVHKYTLDEKSPPHCTFLVQHPKRRFDAITKIPY